MRHPGEGVIRRLLDEPSGVGDDARAHIDACDVCRRAAATIRHDADRVQAALVTDEAIDVDVEAGWRRLAASAAAPARTLATPRDRRWRRALRQPVAACVAAAVVTSGAAVAAANDWLPIFRSEEVQSVAFDLADINAMPDLRDYGDVVVEGEPDVRLVGSAAAAEAATGLDVPEVARLPRGVRGVPTYRVGDEVTVTFTYASDGNPPPPPGLAGTQVRLVAGPGVASVWASAGGVPALIAARAVAPRAYSSSGASFEMLRDHLLSLPDLPDDVAAALRTFNSDGSTLPIPVPEQRFDASSAEVQGHEATVLVSRDGLLAAVTWVDDGELNVVAGALDADEVLSVARALQ